MSPIDVNLIIMSGAVAAGVAFQVCKKYVVTTFQWSQHKPKELASGFIVAAAYFCYNMFSITSSLNLSEIQATAASSVTLIILMRSSLIFAGFTMLFGPFLVIPPIRAIVIQKKSFFKALVESAQKEETRRATFAIFCVLTLLQGFVVFSLWQLLLVELKQELRTVLGIVIGYTLCCLFYLVIMYSVMMKKDVVIRGINLLEQIRRNCVIRRRGKPDLNLLDNKYYVKVYVTLFVICFIGALAIIIVFGINDFGDPLFAALSAAEQAIVIGFFVVVCLALIVYAVFILNVAFKPVPVSDVVLADGTVISTSLVRYVLVARARDRVVLLGRGQTGDPQDPALKRELHRIVADPATPTAPGGTSTTELSAKSHGVDARVHQQNDTCGACMHFIAVGLDYPGALAAYFLDELQCLPELWAERARGQAAFDSHKPGAWLNSEPLRAAVTRLVKRFMFQNKKEKEVLMSEANEAHQFRIDLLMKCVEAHDQIMRAAVTPDEWSSLRDQTTRHEQAEAARRAQRHAADTELRQLAMEVDAVRRIQIEMEEMMDQQAVQLDAVCLAEERTYGSGISMPSISLPSFGRGRQKATIGAGPPIMPERAWPPPLPVGQERYRSLAPMRRPAMPRPAMPLPRPAPVARAARPAEVSRKKKKRKPKRRWRMEERMEEKPMRWTEDVADEDLELQQRKPEGRAVAMIPPVSEVAAQPALGPSVPHFEGLGFAGFALIHPTRPAFFDHSMDFLMALMEAEAQRLGNPPIPLDSILTGLSGTPDGVSDTLERLESIASVEPRRPSFRLAGGALWGPAVPDSPELVGRVRLTETAPGACRMVFVHPESEMEGTSPITVTAGPATGHPMTVAFTIAAMIPSADPTDRVTTGPIGRLRLHSGFLVTVGFGVSRSGDARLVPEAGKWAGLNLGADGQTYGFTSFGSVASNGVIEGYGPPWGVGDTVMAHTDGEVVQFALNGFVLGSAFRLSEPVEALCPAISVVGVDGVVVETRIVSHDDPFTSSPMSPFTPSDATDHLTPTVTTLGSRLATDVVPAPPGGESSSGNQRGMLARRFGTMLAICDATPSPRPIAERGLSTLQGSMWAAVEMVLEGAGTHAATILLSGVRPLSRDEASAVRDVHAHAAMWLRRVCPYEVVMAVDAALAGHFDDAKALSGLWREIDPSPDALDTAADLRSVVEAEDSMRCPPLNDDERRRVASLGLSALAVATFLRENFVWMMSTPAHRSPFEHTVPLLDELDHDWVLRLQWDGETSWQAGFDSALRNYVLGVENAIDSIPL